MDDWEDIPWIVNGVVLTEYEATLNDQQRIYSVNIFQTLPKDVYDLIKQSLEAY